MSRGLGWWGATPLLVGAFGLLLLAFGARGMQDDDESTDLARQEAEGVEKHLNDAELRKEAVGILETEEVMLKQRGKSVDLHSLAPRKGEEMTPEKAAEARQRIYDALSSRQEPAVALAGRLTFYAGLILVFGAGVLLYRRTPVSSRGA